MTTRHVQDDSALQVRTQRWVLAGLSASMLLSSLGTSIANVALPAWAQAFGAAFQQVQCVVLAYLLAVTTLVVSVGRLGDRFGRRRLLLAGVFLFTAASALCGLAPTLGTLIAARAAQGLGAAFMMALALAFVGETVPEAKTGSAMGLLGAVSAAGTALGPTLGGLLIASFGWPAIFFVNLPLGLGALVLVWRQLPADRRTAQARPPGFDLVGTLLLALTLAAYALAMTMGRGSFGRLNVALLIAAVFGLSLFLVAETRAASPLVPLALDTADVGLVMSAGPLAAALAGVPAGRFVDRVGSARASVFGLLAMAAGAAAVALLPTRYGVPGYVGPLVIITAGYALFQAANNKAVMSHIAPDQRGVMSGLLGLSRNPGLITGASVMGAVFAMASAATHAVTAGTDAVAAGMRITLAVGAALVGVALVMASASQAASRRRAVPGGQDSMGA